MTRGPESNVERLEQFWVGEFGDAYTERNLRSVDRRLFWRALTEEHRFASALEVGCNAGDNLVALSKLVGARNLAGIDVNESALAIAHEALPEADLRRAPARELPFADGAFELAFTAMVLIHQPDEALADVMGEVVRCSSRYVLAIEYESDEPEDVRYRGHEGVLFKRPYAALYAEAFPRLRLAASGFLGEDKGWDNVTWSFFSHPGAER
ncbi:MAG: pseudaminic acid biosynthesis-associated methylase [Gaiellaceae bacterium]